MLYKDYRTKIIYKLRQQINQVQAYVDATSQELETLIEEHIGKEGLLSDTQTDTGKVSKASLTARLKELKGDVGDREEQEVLKQCLKLCDREAERNKSIKGQADSVR